jgi:hypothetical protein
MRIGAVMAVRGPRGRFELEVFEGGGWFGAKASGEFGHVEGWLQIEHNTRGPHEYGEAVAEGKAMLCGTSSDDFQLVAQHAKHENITLSNGRESVNA